MDDRVLSNEWYAEAIDGNLPKMKQKGELTRSRPAQNSVEIGTVICDDVTQHRNDRQPSTGMVVNMRNRRSQTRPETGPV